MNDLVPAEPAAILLLVAGALYAVYHHYGRADSWAARLGVAAGSMKAVLGQRLSGAILLGLVPAATWALAADASPRELGLGPWAVGPWWLAVAAALLLPFVAFAARRPAHRARYPEVRVERWTPRVGLLAAAGWAVYLLGYELLFRGLLLFPLAEATDPGTAILASTGLYVLAHLDKDPGECLACAPMGVLFCALALAAGSIWPAFVLHLLIAVTNDTAAGISGAPAGEAAAAAPRAREGTRAPAPV